jgi:outer membrane protein TolC
MKKHWNLLLTSLFLWLGLTGASAAKDLLPPPDKPETLEEVKAIALRLYPSLQASMESVAAARARLEQGLSADYPPINLNASCNANTFNWASGRCQVGVGSPLEITDAEVSLANARANNIQALYNYRGAEAQIERATGMSR